MSSKIRKTNYEHGAALVELAISLPLLIFLMSVVLKFGNIFCYLIWITQSGFQLAQVGGSVPRDSIQPLVLARHNQIIEARLFEEPNTRLTLGSATAPGGGASFFNSANRTVSVTLPSRISPLGIEEIDFPFEVALVGPYLIAGTPLGGSLSDFQNPNPTYNCAFQPGPNLKSNPNCLPTCNGNQIGQESCA